MKNPIYLFLNLFRSVFRVYISPLLFTRLTSIIFLVFAALSLNALFAQCIGSGLAIYSGLFQVTYLVQSVKTFIYNVGALILTPWNSISNSFLFDGFLEFYESYSALGKFCISILLFNYLIISSLIGIVYIFFGDYLIKRFNLETKYPKLAKIVSLRRKFQRYYLILYISYIAFAVFVETVFCLYILSL